MDNRNFIAKRAAAYFRPGDVVNLGIGIPSLCGSYAVDGVLFQSENGFIGIGPTVQEGLMKNERFVNAGGVPFVPVPGSSAFDVAMSFNVIRCGRLAATVLGGLQVSAQGDLANWATPGRAFGMGGAMDLCNGARKVIVAMELVAKDGSPKVVSRCTLPLTAVKCVIVLNHNARLALVILNVNGCFELCSIHFKVITDNGFAVNFKVINNTKLIFVHNVRRIAVFCTKLCVGINFIFN